MPRPLQEILCFLDPCFDPAASQPPPEDEAMTQLEILGEKKESRTTYLVCTLEAPLVDPPEPSFPD